MILGMLGGGQLGRMTALAAAPLGIETHVFCPAPGPATQVTSRVTLAAYDDDEALAAFAAAVDVVTYEWENVPAHTAAFLSERVPVRPGPRALHVAQHRVREKSFFDEIGVPTTAWRAVGDVGTLTAAVAQLGRPCVLKTAHGGYDGKGQTMVREGDDPALALASIAPGPVEAILEAFVDFAYEASVVIARGLDGSTAAYELVENRHRDHILHQTLVPAPATDAVRAEASRIATRIVEGLDYVGIMGVELFVATGGDLLVNEIAPRPHNSGHWTQDGAVTCQFEQHARAVCGLPLGATERLGDVVMTNLIGDDVQAVPGLLADPHQRVHLYGKAETRPGRKMGHVTRVTR